MLYSEDFHSVSRISNPIWSYTGHKDTKMKKQRLSFKDSAGKHFRQAKTLHYHNHTIQKMSSKIIIGYRYAYSILLQIK